MDPNVTVKTRMELLGLPIMEVISHDITLQGAYNDLDVKYSQLLAAHGRLQAHPPYEALVDSQNQKITELALERDRLQLDNDRLVMLNRVYSVQSLTEKNNEIADLKSDNEDKDRQIEELASTLENVLDRKQDILSTVRDLLSDAIKEIDGED